MRQTFEQFDLNHNGVINKEELLEGLIKLNIEKPEEEVERIFNIADFDGSGTLEFSEWCTATMDKKKMLVKSRL